MSESSYKITFLTSDYEIQNPTEVSLTLYGSSGQTEKIPINISSKNDEQKVKALDIGTLKKLNIEHKIDEGSVRINSVEILKSSKCYSVNINTSLTSDGEKSIDFDKITSKSNSRQASSKSKKSEKVQKTSDKNNKTATITAAPSKKEQSDSQESSSMNTKKDQGQGKIKPENHPIKNGEFEYSTHVELKRVKAKLYKEVAKIKYPKRKENHPFVFNDLTPYAETRLADNILLASDVNQPIGYCNRFTAMGVVEPWVAHRMEHTIGPLISRNMTHNGRNKVLSRRKLNQPDQFEGSTLTPSFPKVILKKPRGMNGPFYYDEVGMIRDEMKKNINKSQRFEEDRNRTINDYYRMNLDQTAESLHMTGAYHAYLENTPGSKKALEELLKKLEKA